MLWLSWRHHGNPALLGNVATALELKVTLYPTSLPRSCRDNLPQNPQETKGLLQSTQFRRRQQERDTRPGWDDRGRAVDLRVKCAALGRRVLKSTLCSSSQLHQKQKQRGCEPRSGLARAEGSLPDWGLGFVIYQSVTSRQVSQLL